MLQAYINLSRAGDEGMGLAAPLRAQPVSPADMITQARLALTQQENKTQVTLTGVLDGLQDQAQIAVHAIGGAPVPEADYVYYFGPIHSPVLTVQAAAGQPPGTTYQWSVNEKLTVPDATAEASVEVQGAQASTSPGGDADITCTYTLSDGSCQDTTSITVRKPHHLVLEFHFGWPTEEGPNVLYYPNDPPDEDLWLGFDEQYRRYRLYDHLGAEMPGVSVNEQWLNIQQPLGHPAEFVGPEPGPAWTTDPEGFFEDDFRYFRYRWNPPPALPTRPNGIEMATLEQKLHAGTANAGVGVKVGDLATSWRTNGVRF